MARSGTDRAESDLAVAAETAQLHALVFTGQKRDYGNFSLVSVAIGLINAETGQVKY